MKIGRLSCLAAVILSPASLSAAPHAAQTDEQPELIAERIHSNLPLYTFDWEELWPRNFYSEESFGCTSRVGLGDWRFIPASTEDGQESWARFSNYGIVHCAAIIRWADDREELEEAVSAYGFFVRIGRARIGSREWELWAIQEGTVPGSRFTLLAREADQDGLIQRFRVLQQRCPAASILEAENLDVWSTRYCAINSRRDLLALARRMVRLPPLGTIERVPERSPREPSDEAPTPIDS